jgi:hypothetical protein
VLLAGDDEDVLHPDGPGDSLDRFADHRAAIEEMEELLWGFFSRKWPELASAASRHDHGIDMIIGNLLHNILFFLGILRLSYDWHVNNVQHFRQSLRAFLKSAEHLPLALKCRFFLLYASLHHRSRMICHAE